MSMSQADAVNEREFRRRLLEINIWAMLLIIALALESSAGAITRIADLGGEVDGDVWGAVGVMALVFGLLLATTVGLVVLHLRYNARYGYVHVLLDNVFVTVPLYLAVRFIATSTGTDRGVTSAPVLDEGLFQIGATLISIAFISLFIRDLLVLPGLRHVMKPAPLVAVAALHFLGALLFIAASIGPQLVVYVASFGALGLVLFFAGMAATPMLDERFGLTPGAEAGTA